MQNCQGVDGAVAQRKTAVEGLGLVEWALRMLRGWRGQNVGQGRQMQLVETLGLGGKRQLMLVSCDGERFLVGGGLESVETIVRVRAESSVGFLTKDVDELCR
jgi:flagellar biogenesis protein FliO